MTELLRKLSERFAPGAVKTRRQGGKDLQYIDIASTINRLNEVADLGWSWEIVESSLEPLDGGRWIGIVRGNLLIRSDEDGVINGLTLRAGVGAGVGSDPDMAIKTADAEALKKAGHKLGIGLELWDEDVRAQNEKVMKGMGSDDLNTLKTAVFELAIIQGAEPTADGVADHFGLDKDQLQDPDTLRTIVKAAA